MTSLNTDESPRFRQIVKLKALLYGILMANTCANHLICPLDGENPGTNHYLISNQPHLHHI